MNSALGTSCNGLTGGAPGAAGAATGNALDAWVTAAAAAGADDWPTSGAPCAAAADTAAEGDDWPTTGAPCAADLDVAVDTAFEDATAMAFDVVPNHGLGTAAVASPPVGSSAGSLYLTQPMPGWKNQMRAELLPRLPRWRFCDMQLAPSE